MGDLNIMNLTQAKYLFIFQVVLFFFIFKSLKKIAPCFVALGQFRLSAECHFGGFGRFNGYMYIDCSDQ